MKRYLVFIFTTILLTGCATTNIGLEKHTGFTELPFPSNSYASGQIVEIFSSPTKVEITHQPDIPWDKGTVSPGWNITSTDTQTIRSNLTVEISKILKGTYQYASTENVKVEFSNTKTRIVQKSTIRGAVKKSLIEDPDLKEQIIDYTEDGTHFDVITTTLSANVTFTLVDSSNNEVKIDSEVIKKINSEINIDFKLEEGSNKLITGSNLVIGIHTDPKMVRLLMDRI